MTDDTTTDCAERAPQPIEGSFRDPHARVFEDDERILRGLDDTAAAAFDAVERTEWFRTASADQRLIGTRRAAGPAADALVAQGWTAVLEHDRVPVVTYPYEWSFSMRRDAALLHLDLVGGAVAAGLACKDGSAYNVQFVGARPVFIDLGSFELASAACWPGYRQFCSHLLFPLLIEAHLGVSPAPMLRGSLEGIAPDDAARLLRGTAALRPGVLTHVKAQALAARRYAERPDPAANLVGDPGAQRALTAATVRRLTKVVDRLGAPDGPSEWSGYGARHHYGPTSLEAKDRFIGEALDLLRPATVLDLGCNDGRYSDLACEHGASVVAVDADRKVVDRLYQRITGTGRPILPLVGDLADPSPALGWALRERQPLAARFAPDLVLALALIHHLVIGRNIPIDAFVDGLASMAPDAVLEIPHRDDPMVQRLLDAKPADAHLDYGVEQIEAAVQARFTVTARRGLPGGTRTILRLRRR